MGAITVWMGAVSGWVGAVMAQKALSPAVWAPSPTRRVPSPDVWMYGWCFMSGKRPTWFLMTITRYITPVTNLVLPFTYMNDFIIIIDLFLWQFSLFGGSAWAFQIERDRACPECPVRRYATANDVCFCLVLNLVLSLCEQIWFPNIVDQPNVCLHINLPFCVKWYPPTKSSGTRAANPTKQHTIYNPSNFP